MDKNPKTSHAYWQASQINQDSKKLAEEPSFFDLATIVLFYFVGKKFLNQKVGLVAAALWSVGALPVAYARTLSNPSTTAFWVLLKSKMNTSGFLLKARKALKSAFWPGRFEIVKRGRTSIILDGAHNGHSIRELCRTLKKLYPARSFVFILGTSRDKNVEVILKSVTRIAKRIIITKAHHDRAMEPRVILEKLWGLHYHHPVFWSENATEALDLARNTTDPEVLVITGSLFLVADARKKLSCRTFI